MDKSLCVICQNGDPYSNEVCDKCECEIEDMKDEYRKQRLKLSAKIRLSDVFSSSNTDKHK
jgi:hypothetical protein